MSASRAERMRRACLLIVLATAHVALLILASRTPLRLSKEAEAPLQWVLLRPSEIAASPAPAKPGPTSTLRRVRKSPAEESHAVALAADPRPETGNTAPIDWAAEA